MNIAPSHKPEIIDSNDVIHKGTVAIEMRAEIYKIKASIWITVLALLVACVILGVAVYLKNTELQTWATGLISAVAGAAISYGFAGRK